MLTFYICASNYYFILLFQADILQVAINVNVTCKIIHPEVPCENTTLACVAFLRLKSSQNKSHILSGSCHIEDTSVEQSNKVLSRPQPEEISQNVSISILNNSLIICLQYNIYIIHTVESH